MTMRDKNSRDKSYSRAPVTEKMFVGIEDIISSLGQS